MWSEHVEKHESNVKDNKADCSVCVGLNVFPIKEEAELFLWTVTWWHIFYFHSLLETKHDLWPK